MQKHTYSGRWKSCYKTLEEAKGLVYQQQDKELGKIRLELLSGMSTNSVFGSDPCYQSWKLQINSWF